MALGYSAGMKMTNREKDSVLRIEWDRLVDHWRGVQPTEADIQFLKTEVEFLLDVAERDTGQSRRVRNFLLAWWNAEECGGFDLTDLWNLDTEIVKAPQRIFFLLPKYRDYPDRLGYGDRFKRLAGGRIAAREQPN